MSHERVPPPSKELLAFLAAGRARDEIPAGVRERLWTSLGASLELPHEPPTQAPASTSTLGSAPITARLAGLSKLLLAATFVAGGVVGAGLHAVVVDSTPAVAPPAPVVAPVRSEPPAPVSIAPASNTTPPTPPRRATPRPTPPPAAPSGNTDDTLAAERTLLEMARTALGRGDPAQALVSLERHREAFARGQLVEEREALAVFATKAAGQVDEARRLGTQFREHFPQSLLLPAVEHTLAAP